MAWNGFKGPVSKSRAHVRRRSPTNAKLVAQVNHAKRRAYQRFGIRLTHAEYIDMIRQIKKGSAKFVRRQSNRVSVFEVWLPDLTTAHAVYDKQRHTIVTLLPVEWE